MDANEYQRLAGRTLIETPDVELNNYQLNVTHDTIHRAAASCAVADYAKKGIFHKHGFAANVYRDLVSDVENVPDFTPDNVDADTLFAAWNALGLCGEAGEVAALVDAMIASRQPIDRDALRKELGDVLWYVAALATKAGLELVDIMQANIDKLRTRYPDGYTAEASAARVDVCKVGEFTSQFVYSRCDWCSDVVLLHGQAQCDCICGCARVFCPDCAKAGHVLCHECNTEE